MRNASGRAQCEQRPGDEMHRALGYSKLGKVWTDRVPGHGLLWPQAIYLWLLRRLLKVGGAWQPTLCYLWTSGIWLMLHFRAAMRMTKELLYSWTPSPDVSCEPHRPPSWKHWSCSPTKGHRVQPKMLQSEEKRGREAGWSLMAGVVAMALDWTHVIHFFLFAVLCPSSVIQASCRVHAPTTYPYSAN